MPGLNPDAHAALAREREYHDRLYSGFAQNHFARPAVRALRMHLVSRILEVTGSGPASRVLSVGCGIGDTELILARHVAHIVGIDLSPLAIEQARRDAVTAGVKNVQFIKGALHSTPLAGGSYDLIIAIFLLHHLPDELLHDFARQVEGLLAPQGRFYSLDPNRYRLSGAVGKLLIPNLMRKYQTADERELDPGRTQKMFQHAGMRCRVDYYDFWSSPLAGVFPGWRLGYKIARRADDLITRIPLLKFAGSNFELIADKSR